MISFSHIPEVQKSKKDLVFFCVAKISERAEGDTTTRYTLFFVFAVTCCLPFLCVLVNFALEATNEMVLSVILSHGRIPFT